MERSLVFGPIVQRSWIKIRAGGPNYRVDILIDEYPSEYSRIAKRPEEFAVKHRLQVDYSS